MHIRLMKSLRQLQLFHRAILMRWLMNIMINTTSCLKAEMLRNSESTLPYRQALKSVLKDFLKNRIIRRLSLISVTLEALKQLPGLAIQRLMEKGYGFGGEGDWKTAAMVRLMKIMTGDIKDAKGTSFMEDYTYNLVPGKEGILEAHMLEVCPSIADVRPAIKVQPLSMGDREDPARLVFTSKVRTLVLPHHLLIWATASALIINDVNCKKTEKSMPKLPVATAFWTPEPDLADRRTGMDSCRRCTSHSIQL